MAKTVIFLNHKYDLYILPEARQKMEIYCDLSTGEIGWLGFVKDLGENGFLIEDVALLKQEVHSTTTEITPEGLLEFWGNTAPEDQLKIKLWGHSHVNMGVSPSGQDNDQMEYFKDGNPWFIRLITNKKREYHIDIYDYENGIQVHMDQSDLITYNPKANELKKAIEDEIKEKVSEKKTTYNPPAKTEKPAYTGGYKRTVYSNKGAKKYDLPILTDVDVKVIGNLDEILNDPNYWQAFAK